MDSFHDLETYCTVPIKDGTHRYAESAEVMLWSYALEDGPVSVWDRVNGIVHRQCDLSGAWSEETISPLGYAPSDLDAIILNPETLVWFQNGGHFDFVVLEHDMPGIAKRITMSRRRDTMVQAYAHALPGSLDKMGDVLSITEDKRKISEGRRLVQLFCKPQGEDFMKKYSTERATKKTHPKEWQRFVEYAAGDITTMREAHRLMPKWNYTGKYVDLWHLDCKINERGFAVDVTLAEAAVRAADKAKADMARETSRITEGAVESTTQRDELLKHILEIYGVELPNMQADTLERRLADEDLPEPVRELIGIRLRASMNSVSKFKTLLKGVSRDGRLRGCHQFRGAGRTGRWAHRLFQPGNLPRPNMPQEQIETGIEMLKLDAADLVFDNVMSVCSNTIRGAIIAPPGKKLVVADLSNIEGRVAAWLAGEEWKLQAFRDFDASLVVDEQGRPVLDAKGKRQFTLPDLYIKAYMASFNITDPETVTKDERQIGKVEELMFQYGGGVGAWITGAATYGIDLDEMTAAVTPVLPKWAMDEARQFMEWLYEKAFVALCKKRSLLPKNWVFDSAQLKAAIALVPIEEVRAATLKERHGLSEETFIACDSIKRLWRNAHPRISSYWKELEDVVKQAIQTPGITYPCRRVKIRRDGAWLRIGLPSGRALCYPNPKIEKDGSITYVGQNTYTRQWGRVHTYGGKTFEQLCQAVACDQFAECMPLAEAAGYPIVLHVHDELVCETPEETRYTVEELCSIMCYSLGWNEGLPLVAAGFETHRYHKE